MRVGQEYFISFRFPFFFLNTNTPRWKRKSTIRNILIYAHEPILVSILIILRSIVLLVVKILKI